MLSPDPPADGVAQLSTSRLPVLGKASTLPPSKSNSRHNSKRTKTVYNEVKRSASGKGIEKCEDIVFVEPSGIPRRQKSQNAKYSESWAEKFPPSTSADLCSQKKTIKAVENFLLSAFNQSRSHEDLTPMMVITGPAGSGKTATLKALCRENEISVKEWVSPGAGFGRSKTARTVPKTFWDHAKFGFQDNYSDKNVRESLDSELEVVEGESEQFERFLQRSRYSKLSTADYPERSVLLIEDIPHSFFQEPKNLHSVLFRYSTTNGIPLVLIISDSKSSSSLNSWHLFPDYIVTKLSMRSIQTEACPPSFIRKALKRILNLALNSSQSTDKRLLKKWDENAKLDAIVESCQGDIRAAIRTLQTYVQCDEFSGLDSEPFPSTSSGAQLPTQGGKSDSLFLFRAIGKFLHAKRLPHPMNAPTGKKKEPSSKKNSPKKLTRKGSKSSVLSQRNLHFDDFEFKSSFKNADVEEIPSKKTSLADKSGRMPLSFDPEDVIEKCSLSPDTFVLFLHQNYLEFFPSESAHLADLASAARDLSLADSLTKNWESAYEARRDFVGSIFGRSLAFYNFDPNSSSKGFRPMHRPIYRDSVRNSSFISHHIPTAFPLDYRNHGNSLIDSVLQFPDLYDNFPCFSDIQADVIKKLLGKDELTLHKNKSIGQGTVFVEEKIDSFNAEMEGVLPVSERHANDADLNIEDFSDEDEEIQCLG